LLLLLTLLLLPLLLQARSGERGRLLPLLLLLLPPLWPLPLLLLLGAELGAFARAWSMEAR